MLFIQFDENEDRPNSGRQVFQIQVRLEQEPKLRSVLAKIKEADGFRSCMNKNAWTLEMQSAVTTNDDMEVKQRKEKNN